MLVEAPARLDALKLLAEAYVSSDGICELMQVLGNRSSAPVRGGGRVIHERAVVSTLLDEAQQLEAAALLADWLH